MTFSIIITYPKTASKRASLTILAAMLPMVMLVGCSSVPSTDATPNIDPVSVTAQFNQLSNQPMSLTHDSPVQTVKTLDCASLQSGQALELTGQNRIPATCDLWQKNTHFMIRQSNVSLDCQGVPMSSRDNAITAFTIQTPSKATAGIDNIALKNCAVSGYNHGVLIEQQTPAKVRYQQLLAKQTTREQQKQRSPNHILLNRILVSNSKNSGIFIGDHVQQVTLANSRVTGSGTVGVYLEFGSGQHQIRYNQFDGNGFREFANVAGVPVGKPNREAIAIDSSANNTIAYNRFTGNGAGGVLLYRNCFEHADDPTRNNHFLRTEGSNNNLIEHNIFDDEPVGVWVASRQSRNLKGFACGAYLIQQTALSRYHLDDSEHNVIRDNQFGKVTNAIKLEDDGNEVRFNRFSEQVTQPIQVGSVIREQSSEGVVKGNQIRDNVFAKPLPITQLIAFVGKSAEQNTHCQNFDANQQKLDNNCLTH